MTAVRIDDPDDPRIAAYRQIRERDLVGRQRRFVAEGKVVLNVLLLTSRFETESLLILENRLAGLGDLLARVPAGVPVYTATAPVMDAIAGFPMHRGVLAIGRRLPDPGAEALLEGLGPEALVVALVGIANHDNMGAIFRNAAAFGADALLLDETCCDPLYRKAIRVSVGAALKVPFAHGGDAAAIVEALDGRDFAILAMSPRGATQIADVRLAPRRALILGTEGAGLPDAVLERVATARIPMVADFDSLNVAAASAIALHRLWRG